MQEIYLGSTLERNTCGGKGRMVDWEEEKLSCSVATAGSQPTPPGALELG